MWNKLRQKYMDMPLSNKMTAVFIIILVVFCVTSQAVLQICFTVYDEKLYEKSIQELDYFIQGVNRSLADIQNLSVEIAMDDDVQEQLVEMRDTQRDATYFLGVLEMRGLITGKVGVNNNVQSVAFYDGRRANIIQMGKVVYVPEEVKEELSAPLLNARGGCVTRDPDEKWPYFIAGRNILEKEDARFGYLGTLLINCDIQNVIRRNINSLEAEHANLYVYSDNWMLYQDDLIEGVELPPCREDKGYRIIRSGSHRYFMCYLYSRPTGWMYVNIFPYTEIYGVIQMIRLAQIAAAAALALFSALVTNRLVRTVIQPLNDLTHSMKIVETGDFEGARKSLLLEERGDETGQLQKEFDTMLEKIGELIQENYEKQLLIKDTSYRMLRAQINPHFIYNTLNTINWMVKWKKNDEVSRLIVEFGKLLRSSLSGEPFATVAEEAELTEGYIAIQTYRYQSRADFIVEKSGELEKYQTPRMILQPLVENAIYYGIEDSLEKCTIRVTVREEPGSIFYRVEDSGPGMSPETLQAVRDGTVKSKGNGIGLANIRERLKLLFEDSEFTIDSVSGEGTRVEIRIPKKEAEKPNV
ncbi:MAG: sensor histidine kinase [Oscillospiraceae bacterium]|jgi:two-component system sensor histidine kinase YesM|nr:sensor histidine kinase [Oscillospiraceae bacterium]